MFAKMDAGNMAKRVSLIYKLYVNVCTTEHFHMRKGSIVARKTKKYISILKG